MLLCEESAILKDSDPEEHGNDNDYAKLDEGIMINGFAPESMLDSSLNEWRK